MVHNKRCERANPNSKCRCSCGGKYHGISYGKLENIVTVEKYMKYGKYQKVYKGKNDTEYGDKKNANL